MKSSGDKMYFFDTYAIIELAKGNPRYQQYADNEILTTVLNLAELHYSYLKEHQKNMARALCAKVRYHLLPISEEAALEAMEFRYEHRRKKPSTVDCLGYIIARRDGLKFLTGDQAFKALPNVEFCQ